jgi:aromatic-L-amino-acid decarboxylase
VHKAAASLGIGTDNVCSIQVDDHGGVRVDEMEDAIRRDLGEGYLPMAIIAAAGTRIRGAFDDLASLAALAARYGLWLHVDGAFGAFLKLTADPPPQLEALSLADSITLDPHKLMFLSFDAGCLLVRERKNLTETFAQDGEPLDRSPLQTNYMDQGLQLSRSMKGLKLWLALKQIGLQGYRDEITRLTELAQYLEALIRDDPRFEVLSNAASIIVCFRWIGDQASPEPLRNAVNGEMPKTLRTRGVAYLNSVDLGERKAMRACMINFRTTRDDLDRLMESVRSIAADIHRGIGGDPHVGPPDGRSPLNPESNW